MYKLLVSLREYSSKSTSALTFKDAVNFINAPPCRRSLVWTQGIFVFRKITRIPTFVISFDPCCPFVAFGKQESLGFNGDFIAVLKVYRFVWSFPIVPDLSQEPEHMQDKANTIDVLMNTSGDNERPDLRKFSQVAVSPLVGADVRNTCTKISRAIIESSRFNEAKSLYSRVVVLTGQSGKGKSTSTRMLTSLVKSELDEKFRNEKDSILCQFNPGRPGENFYSIYDDHIDGGYGVIVVEEFDKLFCSVCLGKGSEGNGKMSVQVYDKASWNTLLDNIHNMYNVIVVLTTNMTKEALLEVEKMHDDAGSMLRRIDAWYDADNYCS